MAQGKKGFILYADQKELFDQLPDDKAGILIKHIFKYVNDGDPKSDDIIINIAFTPIKQQLKRDLKHWEDIREKRSNAGKASAEARKVIKHNSTKSTSVKSVQHNSTKSTVKVNDNVKVIVNDNDNGTVINDWIDKNCIGFVDELKQWISIIETKYDNQTSIIQIESWLRLLSGWYKTNQQKVECLNKHIAGSWKTMNFVDIKENSKTFSTEKFVL